MIRWTIYFADGTTGFQVMDDNLSNAYVTDANGVVLTGKLEYSTVPPAPPIVLATTEVAALTTADIPALTTAQISALG